MVTSIEMSIDSTPGRLISICLSTTLLWKAKMQYLPTCKVSSYYILALLGTTGGNNPVNMVNTKQLYNIYTMLDQRRRRWADIV